MYQRRSSVKEESKVPKGEYDHECAAACGVL